MSLATQTVGSTDRLIQLIGDPTTAANLANVLSLSDARNLSGLYALLGQQVSMLLNPSGTFDQQRSAAGTTGIPAVNAEGTKATYSAATIGLTPAATATDFFTILGSGTKTVRVLRIAINGISTAGGASPDIQLIKRITANTGGTSAPITAAQHDSNDAAPTAVVSTYSANPSSLGTSGGLVRAKKLNLGAAGSAGEIVWDFTTRNGKGLVLRGTTQLAALNFNGATVPGGMSVDIDIEWSEE